MTLQLHEHNGAVVSSSEVSILVKNSGVVILTCCTRERGGGERERGEREREREREREKWRERERERERERWFGAGEKDGDLRYKSGG